MGDGYARARARMLAHVARDASGASTSAVAPRAAWAGGATAAATKVGNGGGPATVATARTPAASPVKPRPNLNFLGNTMRAIASANARMDGKKRTREEAEDARRRQNPLKAPQRAAMNGDEKRLRALNKMLRETESLQDRAVAGEQLDEEQQRKLDRLDSVLEEMEGLMGGG